MLFLFPLIYYRQRRIWDRPPCLYMRMYDEMKVRIWEKGGVLLPLEKGDESHVSHGERTKMSLLFCIHLYYSFETCTRDSWVINQKIHSSPDRNLNLPLKSLIHPYQLPMLGCLNCWCFCGLVLCFCAWSFGLVVL